MEKDEKSRKGCKSAQTNCYNSFSRKLLRWVQEKLGIVKLQQEVDKQHALLLSHKVFVREKIEELKEYTRVDADVGFRGNNTIILTGVYRRKAYVQFWDVGDGEFEKLVDQLRYMSDHALLRNIDAPPYFKGTFGL